MLKVSSQIQTLRVPLGVSGDADAEIVTGDDVRGELVGMPEPAVGDAELSRADRRIARSASTFRTPAAQSSSSTPLISSFECPVHVR